MAFLAKGLEARTAAGGAPRRQMTTALAAREQTRARYPDADDPVEADGATRTAHLIAQLL